MGTVDCMPLHLLLAASRRIRIQELPPVTVSAHGEGQNLSVLSVST